MSSYLTVLNSIGIIALIAQVWFLRRDVKFYRIDNIGKLSHPRSLNPFSKPSGKMKPKANDDAKAWRDENDI